MKIKAISLSTIAPPNENSIYQAVFQNQELLPKHRIEGTHFPVLLCRLRQGLMCDCLQSAPPSSSVCHVSNTSSTTPAQPWPSSLQISFSLSSISKLLSRSMFPLNCVTAHMKKITQHTKFICHEQINFLQCYMI